jgi:uncharacterized protein (DUF58 family)
MLKRTGLATLVVFLAIAGTAWATSTAGNQNPQLLVTASLTPTHVQVGDVITAKVTITNTTHHVLRVDYEFAFDGPTRGVAGGGGGPIAPGQTLKFGFHHTVRPGDAGGDYQLVVRATDAHGTSHARAHASSS